jgi:hypothetical protein
MRQAWAETVVPEQVAEMAARLQQLPQEQVALEQFFHSLLRLPATAETPIGRVKTRETAAVPQVP